MSEVVNRFLKYIAVDTSSSEETGTHPSTVKQHELAKLLYRELCSLGIPEEDVFYDVEHCYIYCRIRGSGDYPAVGFISHMDTSPEASGADIKPRFVENYDGGDIILSPDRVLSPEDFPELSMYRGQTLITTDGTTLLGADDKAGIAEIMTMASYFVSHSETEHGDICIAFTPDEEIGEGVEFFDLKRFSAVYAYTVDGGVIGELSYENFNAASIEIRITGRNVHPGEAYNKMINALRVAEMIDSKIPDSERPDTTRDHEGFFHLTMLQGGPACATMKYIIRDHDRTLFEEKKDRIVSICNEAASETGARIDHNLRDSYYNMREMIVPDNMFIVNRCVAAMERAGINPLIKPIRGGTDGAMLSYKGLICPNICAGGHNFHGVYEYISCQSMEKITDLLIEIVKGVVLDT
ncbi:tripeptide aminopeptidase [Ruminococcaceae bacterium YRB3002]|nr:tripeptide aminopeptidase [Ruminococcaceae bacterium YRB3002]